MVYNPEQFKKDIMASFIAIDPMVRDSMNKIKMLLNRWKWVEGKHYKLFDFHKDGVVVLNWIGDSNELEEIHDKIEIVLDKFFDIDANEDLREYYLEPK